MKTTSLLANKYIEEAGIKSRQKKQVFKALLRYQNCTSYELATYAKLDRHMVAKRLPELMPLVTQGESRKCTITGRKAMVWTTKSPGMPRSKRSRN